jgi:uncharacterized protein involved in exopolysaccharide biosynthesis
MQNPVFEAKTKILVRNTQASSLSSYSGLASMLGINISSTSDIGDLVELLKSNAVAEKVLIDLKLISRIKGWDAPNIKRGSLIATVSSMIKPPKISGNVIEITVNTHDPQLSADIANSFVSALGCCWNELNYTEAKQKIKYITDELPDVDNALQSIEYKLRLAPRSSVGVSLGGQGELQRNYEIYSSISTMLKKELETAKLEAAKETPPFSIIDKASVPQQPSSPKTKLNTLAGFLIGLFLGIFSAFFKEYWDKSSPSKI